MSLFEFEILRSNICSVDHVMQDNCFIRINADDNDDFESKFLFHGIITHCQGRSSVSSLGHVHVFRSTSIRLIQFRRSIHGHHEMQYHFMFHLVNGISPPKPSASLFPRVVGSVLRLNGVWIAYIEPYPDPELSPNHLRIILTFLFARNRLTNSSCMHSLT